MISGISSMLTCKTWQFFQSPVACFMRKIVARISTMQEQQPGADDVTSIRNIGLMAHIDAGKTTTTERMLYFSGSTCTMGNVDDGDTVTDYLPQERQRGISITAAAATFHWHGHRVNLIDTPGHVDFTVEVERCLRVLDGAVAIIDAAAGVEAQTITVWRQANRYKVPKIIYVNKMDKGSANLRKCILSIQSKLQDCTLLLQWPIFKTKKFLGFVDLLTMIKVVWSSLENEACYKQELSEKDGNLFRDCHNARTHLIEQLVELDSDFGQIYLETDTPACIKSEQIKRAVRNVVLASAGVPILFGSSFMKKGIRELLDAVVDYLPSPADVPHGFLMGSNEESLCALVFKIIHDKHAGVLAFVRIYSGTVMDGMSVFNVNKQRTEKLHKVMIPFANHHKSVSSLGPGNVAVVTGLKDSFTGDTMAGNHQMSKLCTRLAGLEVPEPVFFCTIEPESPRWENKLQHTLSCLQKEDPSLKAVIDKDTGQAILCGMGELHLEVIHDRIVKEFGVAVHMGDLQIAYRETVTKNVTETFNLDKQIGDTHHQVEVTLKIEHCEGSGSLTNMKLLRSKDACWENVRPELVSSCQDGILSISTCGPLIGYPLRDVAVTLCNVQAKYRTSHAMVFACAAHCFSQGLKAAQPCLLEPSMRVEVNIRGIDTQVILSDLAKRNAQITGVQHNEEQQCIHAKIHLSKLLHYSHDLRVISSGLANFTMEPDGYEYLDANEQRLAIDKITGSVG